jgi:hypothetical protein
MEPQNSDHSATTITGNGNKGGKQGGILCLFVIDISDEAK